MRLWLSEPVEVTSRELTTLEIRGGKIQLCLKFDPRRCLWSLYDDGTETTGDFDRLAKRARQRLTISSK